MSVFLSAYVSVCSASIFLRALCVLDHMNPKTRTRVKLMYALTCAGAISSAAEAWLYPPHLGMTILVTGVAIAHVFDARIYPPRLLRAYNLGRRKTDIEARGLSND